MKVNMKWIPLGIFWTPNKREKSPKELKIHKKFFPDCITTEIGLNTEESPGQLSRLAIPKT